MCNIFKQVQGVFSIATSMNTFRDQPTLVNHKFWHYGPHCGAQQLWGFGSQWFNMFSPADSVKAFLNFSSAITREKIHGVKSDLYKSAVYFSIFFISIVI